MPKAKRAQTPKLPLDYLVVRCRSPKGAVGLAFLGALHVDEKLSMFLLLAREPTHLTGYDEFGMNLVKAVPTALKADIQEMTGRNATSEEILKEISSRYRGDIYADKSTRVHVNVQTDHPEKMASTVIKSAMQIAWPDIADLASKRVPSRKNQARRVSTRARPSAVPRTQMYLEEITAP